MFVLLFLEFDVEDPLADGQSAQLFDFFDLLLAGLFVDHLQMIECLIVDVRIFVLVEGNIIKLVQVLEFILELLQQQRLLLLLLQFCLELDCLVELAARLCPFAACLSAYMVLVRLIALRKEDKSNMRAGNNEDNELSAYHYSSMYYK